MIRRVSKARAKQLREYAKVKPTFLAGQSYCFACGKLLLFALRVLHHFYKRRGALLCWVPGFRCACDECHFLIHLDETAARKANLLAPKECCDNFKRAKQHYESLQTTP